MKGNGRTLANLKHGEVGVIGSIDATHPAVQRLMVLGLVEGAEVAYGSAAIGGDPMEFHLFGCGISLRREEAARFNVIRLAPGG